MNAVWLTLALLIAPPSIAGQASFSDLGLTITAPELAGLQQTLGNATDSVRGTWTGKLGAADVRISLHTFPLEKWSFREPGGVTVVMVDRLREKGDFDVDESFEREGKYGFAPVLSVVSGRMHDGERVVGREYAGSGLLAAHGYSLHVSAQPEPDEEGKLLLARFFEQGIVYAGAERDPAWTEEEVIARWTKDAPEELHEDFERNLSKKAWVKNALLRTEHYIVLTNASGGKKFAEQMEANYDQIGKLFPVPAGKGCRLMPVFLFKTPDDYYAFCVKKRGMTLEEAKRSAGHASSDYYATWYESPTDPTHIHEQTALFIEFLRESKWGKDKFERFLQAVGRAPRKLEKLRPVFLEVYGAEIEAVDREFQAYCAKR